MNFIVNSATLYSHLQAISRVISTKNSLPILNNILFEIQEGKMKITASDSETMLTTNIDLVESNQDGRFTINAKTIIDSMKEIPEQPLTFNINLDTMEVSVVYQNGHYNIVAQSADEYPSGMTTPEGATTLTIGANKILRGIENTLYATSTNDMQPQLMGIYFDVTAESLTVVATDTQRLVRDTHKVYTGCEPSAFILDKNPAKLLRGLLAKEQGDVVIRFTDRSAMFQAESFTMSCRLVEGRYPKYNSVIPTDNPNLMTIDRQTLLGALKRVLIFSNQSTALIKLRLENNQLTVSGQDYDLSTSAEERIACQYGGTPMSIGFKGTLLAEIVGNINSPELVFELADPSRPGVVLPAEQPEEEDILMLLMPMMLND